MRYPQFTTSVLLGVLGVMTCSTAFAVPIRHVDRPLALPEGVLRLDGGPRWPDYDAQFKHLATPGVDREFLNPGVSYGVVQGFEIGAVLPISLAPSVGLENPRLYGLAQIGDGPVLWGLFGQLEIGINSATAATFGVPLFIPVSTDIRLDFGPFMKTEFRDEGTALHLLLPAYLPIQLSQRFFLGPEAGINVYNVADAGSGVALPAGGFLGYTVGRETLADLSFRLRTLDFRNGFDVMEFMLGAEIYF